MQFEWSDEKAKANFAKHGVSFQEAQTVFDDPLFLDYYDPDHSSMEHRFILIGMSHQKRLLMISYTERGHANRIISARKATSKERRIYEE